MAGPDFQIGQSFTANEPLKVRQFAPTGALSIAQGIDTAGQELQQAANFYQADQDRLGKFKALSALDTAQTQAAERLQQMKLDAKPGAENLTKDFKTERDKIFGPAREIIPPKFKPELDYHATVMENNLAQQAFSTEMQERDKYYKDTLTNTLNDKLNVIDANPDQFWEAQKGAVQMIDAAGITTTDKEHILRTWQANSETALFNRIKEKDPEKALVAIGGKVKITNPDKLYVIDKIRKAAADYGLQDYADVAVAVAAQESNFKVDEGNDQTSVRGIFQNDKATRDKWGYTKDVDGNIRTGLSDMRERIEAFKKDFGRAPTPNEYYIYHYQGVGGGKAILKADPNASMWQTLADSQGAKYADKVFKQNPWLNPQYTNAQYMAWSAQVVNNKLYQTGGKYNDQMDIADPTFKNIPYDRRIQLRNSAESEFKQKEETDYRVTHNLETETRDRTFDDAVTLFRQDKLTPEYVDQHQADLGPQKALELDRLLKADDKATNYDPAIHAGIMSKAWAITNPQEANDVIKEAMTARSNKAISKEDYRTIESLVNKSQADGIARSNLVGINSEAIKANFIARTNDPAYAAKQKAAAMGDVEYKKWALNNPNATTEEHSTKVAEIIRGAKLESVGITPSTPLRSIVPLLGDRTPQTASEADIYKAMGTVAQGKAAIQSKLRSAKTNEERADLSRKVLSLNTQGLRMKDILEWKGTPFDSTKFDEFNKPATTKQPESSKLSEATSQPIAKTATQGQVEGLNFAGQSEQALQKQHEQRIVEDPEYATSVMRDTVLQQLYHQEYSRLETERSKEAETNSYVAEPTTVILNQRANRKAATEYANKNADELLNQNPEYVKQNKVVQGAQSAYMQAYSAARAEQEAKDKGHIKVHGPGHFEPVFTAAAMKAKKAYLDKARGQ